MKAPAGGVACPKLLSPQHATLLLLRIAQVWLAPALTAVKMPDGGVACPEALLPQHASLPSVFSPQSCELPPLTAVKVPAGGEDWPDPLAPQQASVPSVLTPQTLWAPASMLPAIVPAGAVLIETPSPSGTPAASAPGVKTTNAQRATHNAVCARGAAGLAVSFLTYVTLYPNTDGTCVSPEMSAPQQTSLPSVRTAQA